MRLKRSEVFFNTRGAPGAFLPGESACRGIRESRLPKDRPRMPCPCESDLLHIHKALKIIRSKNFSVLQSPPSQATSSAMEWTYSSSSLTGFVSSKRRLHWPPNSFATPKLRQMDSGMPKMQVTVGALEENGYCTLPPKRPSVCYLPSMRALMKSVPGPCRYRWPLSIPRKINL